MSDGHEPLNRGMIVPPFNVERMMNQPEWAVWLGQFNSRDDVAFAYIEGGGILKTTSADLVFNQITPDELLLYIQENSEFDAKAFIAKLLQGDILLDRQFYIEDKKGKEISIRGDLEPLIISNKFVGYTFTVRSIVRPIDDMVNEALMSQRMDESNELLEIEKEISELMKMLIIGLAHDIGTPLALINTQLYLFRLQVLKKLDESDRATAEKKIDIIDAYVTKIKNMADSTLRDAMGLDRANVEIEPMDLKSLLNRLVQDFNDLIQVSDNKVIVSLEIDSKVPSIINTSQNMLNRILENLISNAVKYIKDQETSHINIRVNVNDNYLVIDVDDEGIGIPEEKAAVLFQRFGRAKNVGVKVGTGAGLIIVKRMTDLLEGRISYTKSDRGGSVFKLELPLRRGFTGYDMKDELEP